MANDGFWSIIVPEATVNLVTNPSVEYATTGYTAVGGSIARAATSARKGGFGLAVTPTTGTTDGVYYGVIALTSGTTYTVSVYFKGAAGVPYKLSFANTSATLKGTATTFTGDGEWHRYEQTWQADASADHRVYITKASGASEAVFSVDGLQVEAKAYSTSYCDGDVDDCEWSGSRHASTSSRTAQNRSGGRKYNLSTYGITVMGMQGVGMPPILLKDQGQALLPGRRYAGQKIGPRTFVLTADVEGATWYGMHQYRQSLIDVIAANVVYPDQPFWLVYSGADATREMLIKVRYAGGLETGQINGFTEVLGLRFTAHDPFWYEDAWESSNPTAGIAVSDADYVIKQIDGVWSNISTAFDGNVRCFAKAANGNIYIGGEWAADVSTAGDGYGIGIIEYNPTTGALTSIDGGLDGNKNVFDMAVAPNGDLYIVGDFTNAGGVAAADYCAYYDLSADSWTAMGTGLGGVGTKIAIGLDGSIYIVGLFIDLTDANGDYITKWTGSAFVSLGTGLDDAPNAIAIHPNGDLYVAGEFVTDGGVSTTLNGIARWDGSAWNALSTGLADSVAYNGLGVAIDRAGYVYVTGTFDSAGGVTAANIARWNGKAFEALGSGLGDTGHALAISDDGLLYVSGAFTTAGGLTVDRLAIWNGSTWTVPPIDLPGSPTAYAILLDKKDIYLGYSTAGTANGSAVSTATNTGSANAYPVYRIKREGGTSAGPRLLRNLTTGKTVYFDYDLLDGEELMIDFRPGRRVVTSSFFGRVTGAILRGSQVSEFYLQPGANSIEYSNASTGAETITKSLSWEIAHLSIDGGAG